MIHLGKTMKKSLVLLKSTNAPNTHGGNLAACTGELNSGLVEVTNQLTAYCQ